MSFVVHSSSDQGHRNRSRSFSRWSSSALLPFSVSSPVSSNLHQGYYSWGKKLKRQVPNAYRLVISLYMCSTQDSQWPSYNHSTVSQIILNLMIACNCLKNHPRTEDPLPKTLLNSYSCEVSTGCSFGNSPSGIFFTLNACHSVLSPSLMSCPWELAFPW